MKAGKLITVLLALSMLVLSCEKEPGEGGNSSITGYVHVTDWNASFLVVMGQYAGYDEDVYLIYGDDISFSERTRTGPDGRFEFKYLREGKYTVYLYSDTLTTFNGGKVPVKKVVEITSKKQVIEVDTLKINH